MSEDDQAYHRRRAAEERLMAGRSDDPVAADIHRALADLHEAHVRRRAARPVLRMAVPA